MWRWLGPSLRQISLKNAVHLFVWMIDPHTTPMLDLNPRWLAVEVSHGAQEVLPEPQGARGCHGQARADCQPRQVRRGHEHKLALTTLRPNLTFKAAKEREKIKLILLSTTGDRPAWCSSPRSPPWPPASMSWHTVRQTRVQDPQAHSNQGPQLYLRRTVYHSLFPCIRLRLNNQCTDELGGHFLSLVLSDECKCRGPSSLI